LKAYSTKFLAEVTLLRVKEGRIEEIASAEIGQAGGKRTLVE
jgi:hypothetical protein